MKNIEFMLRKLGLRGNLKGFHYLVRAVQLAAADEEYLYNLTKKLYPAIAQAYDTTANCVDRNIRTAVQIIWDRGNLNSLYEVTGFQLTYKPSVGELIDILISYCRSSSAENTSVN